MSSNLGNEAVIYLDLDGDGVPDAVLTRRVSSRDVTGNGCAHVIETTTTIESAIGIDGVAAARETHSEVYIGDRVRQSA